jgi:hypothetical protein
LNGFNRSQTVSGTSQRSLNTAKSSEAAILVQNFHRTKAHLA